MTGLELFRTFQTKAGHAYTGSLGTTDGNRLFRDALISSLEKKYLELIEQKEFDEIRSCIKTEKVFIPSHNKVAVSVAGTIIANITITPIPLTNNYIFAVTTSAPHGFVAGDVIATANIAGITTTPANILNGNQTISSITGDTGFLFFINGITSLTGTYTPNSGTARFSNNYIISDYWHILTMKAKFSRNTFFLPADFSNASPVIMKLKSRNNNLRTGEQITIASVTGNTNANGTHYLKKLNQFEFSLYADKNFQTAIAGNAVYMDGGTVFRNFYEYCKVQRSDQKIGLFNEPSIDFPRFELSENFIKIYPTDDTCSEMTIDYMSIPPSNAFVDVADSAIDLNIFYPEKFQHFIIDEARRIFAEEFRDMELYQQAQAAQIKNP